MQYSQTQFSCDYVISNQLLNIKGNLEMYKIKSNRNKKHIARELLDVSIPLIVILGECFVSDDEHREQNQGTQHKIFFCEFMGTSNVFYFTLVAVHIYTVIHTR